MPAAAVATPALVDRVIDEPQGSLVKNHAGFANSNSLNAFVGRRAWPAWIKNVVFKCLIPVLKLRNLRFKFDNLLIEGRVLRMQRSLVLLQRNNFVLLAGHRRSVEIWLTSNPPAFAPQPEPEASRVNPLDRT